MSTHKRIDVICIVAVILSLLVTVLFMNGQTLGIEAAESTMGYEQRLFDTQRVHTIDIVMEDWDGFLETCTNEEYTTCTAVIDGERFTNIGIRAKGNTSLSTVAAMDSNRYSFKLEFDQYDSTKSYYGLDKLSLNNLIQDNTLMKDYLTYQLMARMDAAAPLCSYVYITVNGEDWGLYLAVEAIEESFLQRNYGTDYGALYKPDAMSNGGGRGNGKDFDMEQWQADQEQQKGNAAFSQLPSQNMRGELTLSGDALREALENQGIPTERLGEVSWDTITMEELAALLSQLEGVDVQALMQAIMGGGMGNMPAMGGSKGSADVKLQYVDDRPESYANIFNNAKTAITEADQARLIQALQKLSSCEDLETTLDVEALLRYFVVHTFVCNEDSYTGTMVHNYYLYEKDGQLSMLPWDYNLAFGGFRSGNASTVVNSSIDNPISGSDGSDRPMWYWIFSQEEYTRRYHQLYEEFLNEIENLPARIGETAQLIGPYVEKDPTKFCTAEEFEIGVSALQQFVQLRSESIGQQLAGEEAAVDASGLNLSDMGSMSQGKGNMHRPNAPTGEGTEQNVQPGQMPEMQFPGTTTGEEGTQQTPQPGQMPGMQPPGTAIGEEGTQQTPQPGQMPGMQPPGTAIGEEGTQQTPQPGQMPEMQFPGTAIGEEGTQQTPQPGQMPGMQPPGTATGEEGTQQTPQPGQMTDLQRPSGGTDQGESRQPLRPGAMQEPGSNTAMARPDPAPLIITIVCIVLLLLSILAAVKYRRRK